MDDPWAVACFRADRLPRGLVHATATTLYHIDRARDA